MIGMFFGVQKYIEVKDERLSSEIHSNLHAAFEGKDIFIDVDYSDYNVGYEKMNIPQKSTIKRDIVSHEALYDWNQHYGDLSKMYQINWDRVNDSGWNLVTIIYSSYIDGYYVTRIFPYAVGYIKQASYWDNQFLPSIQTAVDEAFEFFTENPESNFIDDYEKGSFYRILS